MRSSRSAEKPDLASAGEGERRPYAPPELIEWGSLLELTRGPDQETQDFPMVGGTGPT